MSARSEDPRRRRSAAAAQSDRGDPEDRAQRGQGAVGEGDLLRSAVVEIAIQQAIRRGDFDDLPGAGKPIPGLGEPHDPDWWIRRKIETEDLHGLGPAALTLRVEDERLDARLDALATESDVREALEDFNRRVLEARRQLRGGPPVITPTRDVESEVVAWRARRAARRAERGAERPSPARRRRRLFRRR